SPRRGDTRTPEDAAPSGLSVFIGTPLPGAGAAGLFKWTPLRGVLHHPFPLHRGGSRCFKPSDIAVSLATGVSEYMTLITDRSPKAPPSRHSPAPAYPARSRRAPGAPPP